MTAIQTTTTTSTTTATKSGVQLVVGSQANTQQVGNFVTNVSLQPYIAPTIISFYAFNMKPNCLLHVFFDSVLVDQYCAPGLLTGNDTSDYNSITRIAAFGTPIYSDSFGFVAGQFQVPAATFKTGDRALEICDVTSLTLGTASITTQATSTFTASNLNVTKQAVTLTTVNPVLSVQSVTNTVTSSQTSTNTTVLRDIVNIVNNVITNTQVVTISNTQYYLYHYTPQVSTGEPIAQALTIQTPAQQSGIFATSLDLYFQQRSLVANNGVSIYLCETKNGYPDGKTILPFSKVHLPYANVAASANATTPTNFKFESPVFLQNDTEYAFVVQPDANDPDYRVWTANIGDIDVTTGVQVFSQPLTGTAFYGATQAEWTALQTEYIKFNLRRASFLQGQGDAYFNNSNTDYISIFNIAYANTSAAFLPGDYVYQSTNSTANTANTSKAAVLSYYDSVKQLLYVENSTGLFTNSSFVQVHRFANASVATPNTTTLVGYANTATLFNPVVDAVVPQLAAISPPGTGIVWGYSGVSNTYVVDTSEYKVTPGYESEFYDQERLVASLSNEVSTMGGTKSFTLHANLTTDSSWVSPAIDTVRNQELVIQNKIDPVSFNYNEFFNYSNTQSKYISQIVTLAAGQDAEDLQISLTAHRPIGTDVAVWVKFLNGEDADPISLKTWMPMVNRGQSVYADPSNPGDFREYNYVTPSAFRPFTTNGTITCANTSANVTGTATSFGADIKVGWWINMAPNSSFIESARQVISITNTTFMTLNAPFTGNYTANAFFLVAPPTTPFLSSNTQYQIAGTITTSTTNNSIIGVGTNFTGQLTAGSILKCANDQHVIVSITNTTFLTVDSPFLNGVAGANAYLGSPSGLSYLNSINNLFSTYKQFQIKIVLQSNDSSKVPLIDDLRALALQL
jgi:hypothetical protein